MKRFVSRVKEFIAWLKNPFRGWKNKLTGMNRKRLLWIGIGGVLVMALSTGAALKVTSTPQFCSSCHEMAPEYATWEVTSHAKIACVTCHIEPGAGNFVKHKMGSLVQLYEHFTGKIPQPIVMPHPIKNEVCEECHSTVRKVTASGDIIIPHDKHLKQGIACVACHAGVAHGFVAERGLTPKQDYATWTTAKAEKHTTFDNTRLGMEVCLNCHDQVNQGKKPWLENEGQGQTEKQRLQEQQDLQKLAATATGKLPEPGQTAAQASAGGLHPPMKCDACHSAIKTPDSHHDSSWGTTHGITARQDVRYCASCHSRQKERVLLTANTDVKDYARSNSFCVDCHAKRPAGHLEGKKEWLPAHSSVVREKSPANCLTCHDVQQPTQKSAALQSRVPGVTAPGPNPVYCNLCHWFKDDKIVFKSRK